MKWRSSSKKRRGAAQASTLPRAKRAPVSRRDASGRVSLVVCEDADTGRETWRLGAPVFEELWQDVLAESVANITVRSFEPDATLRGAIEVARDAMKALSGMCEGWLSAAPGDSVACKEGCSHCCHQPVSVTPVEALVIASHLRSTRSHEQLERLTEQLGQRRVQVYGMSREQQYAPEYPCLFLEEGRCSIYEVRPLVCRGMNSLDVDHCRQAMHDAETKAAFFRHGGGLCYLEPIQGAHAMLCGLDLGLADVFGLDMRVLSLTDAVHSILSDPSLGERWITGERFPHDASAEGRSPAHAGSEAARGQGADKG